MWSWIKDVPESVVGMVIAVALWFAFNYVVLAPRAMGNHFEKDFYPACARNLKIAQEAIVEKAQKAAEAVRSELHSEIRDANAKLRYVRNLNNIYGQSGLSNFIRHYGMDMGSETANAVEVLKGRIEEANKALNAIPDFETLRQSQADLLKTCACAGLQVMTGARVDYAIHTASFRLIEPNALASLKQKIGDLTRTSACSAFPWEGLRGG